MITIIFLFPILFGLFQRESKTGVKKRCTNSGFMASISTCIVVVNKNSQQT